jgi:hypothetical protein
VRDPTLRFLDAASFTREVRAQLGSPGAAPAGDPHLSLAWFGLLAETAMPAGAKLALGTAARDSSLRQSFLPLMRLVDQPQRVLGLSNFYTPLFGLVDETAADPCQLENLARQLKEGANGCAEVRFAPMDTESASYVLLKGAFRAAGWLVDDYFCFGNWYQPVLPGEAAAYLAARPSKLRNTLRRAEGNFAKTSGFALEIIRERGAELEAAIADFVNVYNRSWKQPEPFPEFIPGLCRLAADNGWLRLGLIRVDGRPLAAQLWLVADHTAYIVKLAYDQDFRQSSAGTVLTAALCRHVINVDRVGQIDYLIGDDPYKQDWMSQRRERRGIVAFNLRHWRGMLGALRHFAGRLRRP